MKLILYRYAGERNRIDKSGELVKVLDIEGYFKSDVSMISPILFLALPFNGVQLLTDENGNVIDEVSIGSDEGGVLDFNYFYVEEFRRYYYLSSMTVSSKNLVVISGDVDPLYSFKEAILQNAGMIERNEFEYNLLLDDANVSLKPIKTVTEYDVLDGEFVNLSLNADIDDIYEIDGPNIVSVTLASDAGVSKVIQGFGNLPSINTLQSGDAGGQVTVSLNVRSCQSVMGSLMANLSAYSSYFKSMVVYPFVLDDDGLDYDINVYKYEERTDPDTGEKVTQGVQVPFGVTGKTLNATSGYKIVADFVLPEADSFLDLNPYSHYELFIPFYGWYELDFNQISGHRLTVYYAIDYSNGSGTMYLFDYTTQRVLFSSPCQIGVSLSISSTNAQELQAQKNAMQLNLVLSLLGSGIGAVGSLAGGNALGAVGSGLSAVQAITSFMNQKSMMFQRITSTSNGSAGALYNYLKCRLRITRSEVLDSMDWNRYSKLYGRPLQEIKTLSDLRGFTKVSSIHLHDMDALDVEKREIESSLLNGVII